MRKKHKTCKTCLTKLEYTDALTHRQEQVAKMLAGGAPAKEIARVLNITVGTVKWHITTIYAKHEVKTKSRFIVLMNSQKAKK